MNNAHLKELLSHWAGEELKAELVLLVMATGRGEGAEPGVKGEL